MWLFTTLGFFSAVEHREDRGLIMVRARVHRHITHLRDAVQARREGDYQASEALDIIELEDADYRFRLTITREEWVDFVTGHCADIDYDNFKSAASRRGAGALFMSALHRVWDAMYKLQGQTLRHPEPRAGGPSDRSTRRERRV